VVKTIIYYSEKPAISFFLKNLLVIANGGLEACFILSITGEVAPVCSPGRVFLPELDPRGREREETRNVLKILQ
jgi:hypothetical protein